MSEVQKYGSQIHVSAEALLQQRLPDFGARLDRILNATPTDRARWKVEREAREARETQERAELRATTETVPLSLEALTARLDAEQGWNRAYLEHLVQPYCKCGTDIDGWSYCDHARDQGLVA